MSQETPLADLQRTPDSVRPHQQLASHLKEPHVGSDYLKSREMVIRGPGMNDIGNFYTPHIRPLAQDIPDRPSQYMHQTNSNYNYRKTTLPNCMIGRRHNRPEREDDTGAFQASGVPLNHSDVVGRKITRNVAGYVKPSYTMYG